MSTAALEFRRGWRPLVAAAVGNGSGLSGLSFYTFGVFVLPLVAAFGWTRGEVSIAASFLIVGTAITAPIIGGVIDRYGAKRVGIYSMIALGLGYAVLTRLDGTLGVLSPGFSVVSAGKDLARQAAEEQGGDPNAMLQQALMEELPVLRRLPADVARTLALASRGSLQFRTVRAEDEDRLQRTLWNRMTMAFVGAVIAVMSVLMMGLEVGPLLGGDTRLVVVLGAGGVFLGTVLMLRVVAAVIRDGTS